ncbi:YitT family protein [Candidatus Amarolinea aalborgensis]|jgi:uncharacterized membrane-anchored protein YitT (DUF2179 family)|uniref:YitT family protein n=1 Tax=Candidatus Amarolinea aalborgensis TaxID=2249329 RepID=UPI003BF9E0CB
MANTEVGLRLHPVYRVLRDALFITLGCLLMALAVDIFLDPNNVVPGGFTAIAIFANRLRGWPTGLTLLALNIPFLALGIWLLGAEFGPKTIAAAVLVSLAIDFLQPYLPTVQGEPLLYVAYGGLLFGAGQALVFRAGATSGGTELPAKLLEHFYGIRMSRSLLAMDALILGLAALFFGLGPALYALITAWVMARVIDFVDLGFNASHTAFIVTQTPDDVRTAILHSLGRGVTVLTGQGGFTGSQRIMLFTVVHRREVGALRRIVSAADPDAFMVINPSTEVLGEGFKPLTRARRR